MARKSIKGYSEKNYYDNIRFNGVRATTDYLNEGYFKHLVNFDISDTGASLKPREGYLTTKFNGLSFAYSDQVVYFKLLRTGEYIFVDLHDFKHGIGAYHDWVRKGTLDIENEYIVEPDSVNLNQSDSFIALPKDDTFTTTEALPVLNKNGTQYHVFKYSGKYIQMLYSYEGGVYDDTVAAPNTLFIDIVDTEDIKSIDTNYRNIASSKSIIPVQFTNILPSGSKDHVIQQFPLIYVQDNSNEKYLINTTDKLDLTLKPYFTIKDYPEASPYRWAYTYDIYSTKFEFADLALINREDSICYRSPIYNINDNSIYKNYYMYWKDFLTKTRVSSTYADNSPNFVVPSSGTATASDLWMDKTQSIEKGGWPTYKILCEYYNKELKNFNYKLSSIFSSNAYVLHILPYNSVFKDSPIDFNQYDPRINSEELWTEHDFFGAFSEISKEHDSFFNSKELEASYNIYKKFSTLISSYKKEGTLDDVIAELANYNKLDDYKHIRFYLTPLSDYTLSDDFETTNYSEDSKFILSDLYSFFTVRTSEPLTFLDLISYLRSHTIDMLVVTPCMECVPLKITSDATMQSMPLYITRAFPGLLTEGDHTYYICTKYYTTKNDEHITLCKSTSSVENFLWANLAFNTTCTDTPTRQTERRVSQRWIQPDIYTFNFTKSDDSSLFEYSELKDLQWVNSSESTHPVISRLTEQGYFDNGLVLVFYLFPLLKEDEYLNITNNRDYDKYYIRGNLVSSTSLYSARALPLSSVKPTYIVETITKEPKDIQNAIEYIVFNDSRLVTWIGNTVYMSEEGDFNYFTYANVFTFDERVVKVIQYKDTLLVFTKLHLYSIFPYENTVTVQDGVDDEGNPKYVQQTQTVYNKLPVLYNLRVDDRYKDAIQVFNQMVLFYSSEGQMYMIKPTATIDSNTRFSIQYFNQDVNDILLNYDTYMTERLQLYGTNKVITKDMVNIKVHVSINYITIYYTVPSLYTYILIYDIVNNRYSVYDTMSFSDIRGFISASYGDFVVTSFDSKLYFTTKYTELYTPDSNIDKTVYYNFKSDDIHLELDTGVINLNNHLKKRFRQLHLIYKNLDARDIEFTLETFVDDVPQLTYMSPTFELKSINNKLTREVVYNSNVTVLKPTIIQLSPVNMLDGNTALFDFSAYTSNNIITHNINIPSLGRALRMRFTFKSKGKFKFQGYGLIYKEHQV